MKIKSCHKIIKVGNSLAVTLPANFVRALALKVSDTVEVSCNFDQSITYTFPNSQQLTLLKQGPIGKK